MLPGLFLDRDGVIIQNRDNYVRSWADVEFLPGVLDALRDFKFSPYKIVIITNQSAVGRGLMTRKTAEAINRKMVNIITEYGGRIDGVYLCPHIPEEQCQCRKPNPGLIFQAATDLQLDLANSVLIGDALSDIQAGIHAGIARLYLVLTGRGKTQAGLPAANSIGDFEIVDSLPQALMMLLKNDPNRVDS